MDILKMSPQELQAFFEERNPSLTNEQLHDIIVEQQRTIARLRKQISENSWPNPRLEQAWREDEAERGRQGIFG